MAGSHCKRCSVQRGSSMNRKSASRKLPLNPPLFRDLSIEETKTVLAHNHVGRIAFSFHDIVDIRPIHYVLGDDWLFGRTSPGDKLVTLQHHQWIAFEVDEISGPFDWRSVIIHGTFHLLEPGATEPETRLYERALRAIKSLTPDALTDADLTPFRTNIFGISIDSVTGRSSTTEPRA
jgi:nitroimidazol reductase NimA-like FMN-containing flavoprotein (pyridoxamine 5'-phosphate oxidase superfamily)